MSDIASSSSYLSTPATTRSRSISQPQQHRPLQHSPSGSPNHLHQSPMMNNLSTSPSSPARMHQRSLSRSLSNNAIQKVNSSGLGLAFDTSPSHHNMHLHNPDGLPLQSGNLGPAGQEAGQKKGRGRSSSLVTVTEVGGDDTDQVVDRLGVGVNENANWVNAPGQSGRWIPGVRLPGTGLIRMRCD